MEQAANFAGAAWNQSDAQLAHLALSMAANTLESPDKVIERAHVYFAFLKERQVCAS